MSEQLSLSTTVIIDTPADKVWNALTDPAQIKQWLMGTAVTSDWKKGSSITYSGQMDGKHYQDKGEVIDVVPGKMLHTTYWSSLRGKEDIPENYANVTYELEETERGTELTLTQDNIDTEEEREHSLSNWNKVLDMMKGLLEK